MPDWNQAEIDAHPDAQIANCLSGVARIELISVNVAAAEVRIIYNNGIRFTLNGTTATDVMTRLNETITLALEP